MVVVLRKTVPSKSAIFLTKKHNFFFFFFDFIFFSQGLRTIKITQPREQSELASKTQTLKKVVFTLLTRKHSTDCTLKQCDSTMQLKLKITHKKKAKNKGRQRRRNPQTRIQCNTRSENERTNTVLRLNSILRVPAAALNHDNGRYVSFSCHQNLVAVQEEIC